MYANACPLCIFIETDIDRRRITVSENWKEGNGYE